ncbi:T9SS type A sorting domain-containing protein [Candidatus Poribacteria bacterium]|nr:T9SS type A sorting domain-containing protein [Candidatus Poribacteria bacterium]
MKGFRILLPYIIGISLFLITGWAYAATFIVDNLGDADDVLPYTPSDGTNTLRKCIRLANNTPGADTINFSVSGTISPTSGLPTITDDGTVIDASSQWIGVWPGGQPGITLDGTIAGDGVEGLRINGADNCHIRGLFITNFGASGIAIVFGAQFNTVGGVGEGYRNVISGNVFNGVSIWNLGTNSNIVSGNYIGTDVTGTAALGNRHGVEVGDGAKSNTIGGRNEGERNIISGNNGHGVGIWNSGTNSNIVSGNYIGTDVTGIVALGNLVGVVFSTGAQSNIVGGTNSGEGNTIAFNSHAGVAVQDTDTDYNKISGNSTHDNGGLGIDIWDGGNDEIPAPIITSNNLVGDTLIVSGNGAGANATVEIFKADSFESGEGMTYLGSLVADEGGNFSGLIDVTGKGLSCGDPLVATTTHTNNNTSEFSSPPVPIEGPPQVVEVWPEPGATAKRETKIYAIFSKPMDESTLTSSTVIVEGTKSGVVNGSITYEPDISRVVFTPDVLFVSNEQVTVTLTGDIKDTEGNGLDGDRDCTSEGSPEDDFRWEFSTMPHALSVDGDGYVEVPDNDSLDITNRISLEAWIFLDKKVSDPGGNGHGYIVCKSISSLAPPWNLYSLLIFHNQNFPDMHAYFQVSDGVETNYGVVSASIIPIRQWVHIAGVYDGTKLQMFVNGNLESTNSVAITIGTNDIPIAIGRYETGAGQYFPGLIDEVRIWSIARTQSEIQATMNTTLKGDESGLVGYWNFDDSTANDSSPYGNHGTLEGDADIIPLVGTWPPKKIGDVSGNGTISAYDASLILQYVVGLISEFPADSMGSPSAISPRSYIVRIPEISAKAGDRIYVPIAINDATGLFAGGISLKYDRTVLRAIKALPDMALNGSYWKANTELDGEVRFAFATTEVCLWFKPQATVGKCDLLMVEFEVLPNAEGKTSRLIIDNVNLSNSLNIEKINGSVTVIPSIFALLQNYPNPFNPDTWIPFKLATDASVTINIYNQKGQLIRTIALGQKAAGMYLSKDRAAYWDGRDDFGEKVSSGVYFYSLRAGEFIATRKLVVVK